MYYSHQYFSAFYKYVNNTGLCLAEENYPGQYFTIGHLSNIISLNSDYQSVMLYNVAIKETAVVNFAYRSFMYLDINPCLFFCHPIN